MRQGYKGISVKTELHPSGLNCQESAKNAEDDTQWNVVRGEAQSTDSQKTQRQVIGSIRCDNTISPIRIDGLAITRVTNGTHASVDLSSEERNLRDSSRASSVQSDFDS